MGIDTRAVREAFSDPGYLPGGVVHKLCDELDAARDAGALLLAEIDALRAQLAERTRELTAAEVMETGQRERAKIAERRADLAERALAASEAARDAMREALDAFVESITFSVDGPGLHGAWFRQPAPKWKAVESDELKRLLDAALAADAKLREDGA